jgi:hypothetical protein
MRQWGDYEVPGGYARGGPPEPWRYDPGQPGYGPLPQLLHPGPGPRPAPGSGSWVTWRKGFAVVAAGMMICVACVASAAESTRPASDPATCLTTAQGG